MIFTVKLRIQQIFQIHDCVFRLKVPFKVENISPNNQQL